MSQPSLREIEASLMQLPYDLAAVEGSLAQLKIELDDLTSQLEMAKVNASLNAPDGRNAEARELARKQSIATDRECVDAQHALTVKKIEIANFETEATRMRRQFAAQCHLAELRAAQLQLQAKGVTREH